MAGNKLQMISFVGGRNASAGKKANIIFDKEQFLTLYYRHICEIFDESLRRKPFDSVIDYIDGYLEIELEQNKLSLAGAYYTAKFICSQE